jgi:hypothetical protein
MVLLRKNNVPRQVQDYRPISLIHSFSKLITKALSTRLAPLMQQLVQPNESAFIKGRVIHDNFHTVQQTAKLMHAQKWSCCQLKVDIAKAFDTMSWPFLLELLHHAVFSHWWINCIDEGSREATRVGGGVNWSESNSFARTGLCPKFKTPSKKP